VSAFSDKKQELTNYFTLNALKSGEKKWHFRKEAETLHLVVIFVPKQALEKLICSPTLASTLDF
jgi:hypothetical protein